MKSWLLKCRRNRIASICLVVIFLYLAVAVLCEAGLAFSDFDISDNNIAYQAPSSIHWLGTDLFGRDVLARAAQGTTTSLLVGFLSAALALTIGTVLGAVAGYFGGLFDELIVWLYTTIDTIPYILLVVAFSFVLGPGIHTLCIVIGLTSWIGHCRVMRAEFMRQRSQEYVQSAEAVGASHLRRIFIHILPNTLHLILVDFSLIFVTAIKSEVILSYLGLGAKVGTPSWGLMISDAQVELSRSVWWGLTAASLFMFFLVLAVTLFNDSISQTLSNPNGLKD